MDPLLIALFVLASLGGTALIAVAIRAGAKAKEAQRKMAAQNGWQFEFVPASGGKGSETLISDPAEGWTLTLYSRSGSSSGSSSGSGSSVRWSMHEDPGAAIPEGMAVLGPDIPEKTAAMADKMMGLMGGDIGRWLLDKMTGGLGEEAQGLRSVESDGPGHLMASPGAETALDDVRFAPELNNARAGKNEAQQPLVMRGSFGLRVRVGYLLRKPEEIEAFIALGRALSDTAKG
ncbi:MAG: hypothetical protein QNJ16_16775 [Rhodobacter sp.]|nr:hypothetical protein [Rhodobacter sp.]